MDRIEKAITFATQAHLLQKRKHSGIPYIVHPIEVMKRVSDYGVIDDTILAAAVLHDVKEDCSSEWGEKILTEFGWDVHSIVVECSRPQGDDATKPEKYRFLQSFSTKSIQSVIIKIADRYCNVHDYIHTSGKYASKYALQAYPLYQSFIQRYTKISDTVLPHKVSIKVLGDIADLNTTINTVYKDFSCFVCNNETKVKGIVIGGDSVSTG